jgi:hypothetical protein
MKGLHLEISYPITMFANLNLWIESYKNSPEANLIIINLYQIHILISVNFYQNLLQYIHRALRLLFHLYFSYHAMLLEESAMFTPKLFRFMPQQTEGHIPLRLSAFNSGSLLTPSTLFILDIMSIKTTKTEKQSKPQT